MQVGPTRDSDLIDATRRGDQAAFAQIVERYQHTVFAVAYATTRDRALADDVTQEAFVAAWRTLGELRDHGRLPAWLCGIARNRARDILKQRRRQEARDAAVVQSDAQATPFEALSDAESERIVVAALDAVPAVYREPLVLHYIEQQPVADIARLLGLDAGTTNKRLSRGRQQLAARVGDLVEPRVRLRGPRPDVVVGVLASIAVLGSASHVDASPTAKGSTMLKIAVPTLLVATVTGSALLASGVATPTAAAKPGATNAAMTPRPGATPATRTPAAAPSQGASTTSAPPPTTTHTRGTGPRPALSDATDALPDCTAVARHLAEAQFDRFESSKASLAAMRKQFVELRSQGTAKRCVDEKWSIDRRVCLMSATDSSDQMACAGRIATDEEIAALPPELQCDAVAAHLTKLATALGAKFDIIAKKMAAAGKPFDMNKVEIQVRTNAREECESVPWAVSLRRCIADAKTHDETAACW